MNALNLDNWICDLYSHIDAQRYITGLDQRQYRDEIHWAYRLGYLTREEYYLLRSCGMSAMIIPRRYIIIMDGGDEKQQISQGLDDGMVR